MKKIFLFFITLLFSMSLSAQRIVPISFLGIPVDGSKENMVSILESKGFTPYYFTDDVVLIGDFNGMKSHIYIHTNRNVVDRVMVTYDNYCEMSQIRIRFNNLLYQFQHNSKYYEEENNVFIPDDENIQNEIFINHKEYYASFKPNFAFSDDNIKEIRKAVETMNHEEAREYLQQKKEESSMGSVWFRIFEDGIDKYNIAIYYDNLLNRNNGEDL